MKTSPHYKHRLHFACCILAMALLCPALAQAQAKITIQPQREGLEVNPLVLRGYNFGNWMPVTEMGKALATVPAATLRFPGGNAGDEFDLTDSSLDIFVALQALVPGDHTMLMHTRVFGDPTGAVVANTPEGAAAAVKMAADIKLKVSIWEIGNEPDLFSKIRGDKTWNVDRYCDVFRAQAKAIKAVNPAALVAGPAISGDRPDGSKFLERFVLRCGDVVDVLTWHIYPTGGDGDEGAALASVKDFNDIATEYRTLWADATRNPLGYQRKIQYGVTEYGLSWRSNKSRFLADQAGALWAAEGALRMASNGIHIAHYFAYLATSFHGLLDLSGIPRPTYYGFGMLAGLKGKFVAAESDDAKVWVHAIKNAQTLDMVVINTHDVAQDVALSVDGYAVESVQYFDADIVEQEKELATLPAKPQLSLPAKSMVRISLKAAK